jgi:hypothetical protein
MRMTHEKSMRAVWISCIAKSYPSSSLYYTVRHTGHKLFMSVNSGLTLLLIVRIL